jgi:hypothetical protein
MALHVLVPIGIPKHRGLSIQSAGDQIVFRDRDEKWMGRGGKFKLVW